jgi:hypothetical protein
MNYLHTSLNVDGGVGILWMRCRNLHPGCRSPTSQYIKMHVFSWVSCSSSLIWLLRPVWEILESAVTSDHASFCSSCSGKGLQAPAEEGRGGYKEWLRCPFSEDCIGHMLKKREGERPRDCCHSRILECRIVQTGWLRKRETRNYMLGAGAWCGSSL